MSQINLMQKLIDIIAVRVFEMIRLGEVKRHQGGKTQSWQIETAAGETVENAKHLEPFGFTSQAPVGSETLIFNVQGSRINNVVLNIGNRELRFQELKDGEVAMYDTSGNLLHFKNGGIIDFKAADTMKQTAQTINISGSAAVNVNPKSAAVSTDSLTVKAKTASIDADTTTVKAKTATVDAETTTVNGKVNLAGGGQPVARLGDTVEVDPNTHKGTITGGSTEVTAG